MKERKKLRPEQLEDKVVNYYLEEDGGKSHFVKIT